MGRAFLAFLVVFLYSEIAAQGGEKAGFQNIPFGSPYNMVKEHLISEGLEKRESIEFDEEYGSSVNKRIHISSFSLGTLTVDVVFYFDHEGNFYSFSFHTHPVSAQYLTSTVKENGQYLSDVLKKKYGKPARCFSPSILEISSGYVSYLCRWKNAKLDIYTGIAESDFKYYALASIENKEMKKNLDSFNKNRIKIGVSEGADKF